MSVLIKKVPADPIDLLNSFTYSNQCSTILFFLNAHLKNTGSIWGSPCIE